MPRRDRLAVALGAAALVVPFLVGASRTSAPAEGEVAFRFADPEIVESSGLVATDAWVATVNDSGDTGRVFVVDRDTGETVGVTHWREEPVDVEALAPAGEDHVWVGDIGDNTASRDSVVVARVPVGEGERTVEVPGIELVYRGGPRNAEALLAHPETGRLYVVTKSVFGGEVHAAPADLSGPGPHRLKRIGEVSGVITGGTFLRDGRHLVVRTYGRASLYTFPALEQVDNWDLPSQEQGEAVAAAPDGSLLLSSEGQHSEVLRVEVPTQEPAGGPTGEPTGEPAGDPPAPPTLWDLLASLFDG